MIFVGSMVRRRVKIRPQKLNQFEDPKFDVPRKQGKVAQSITTSDTIDQRESSAEKNHLLYYKMYLCNNISGTNFYNNY